MIDFDPKKVMALKKKLDVASAKFDDQIKLAIRGPASLDILSQSFFKMNGASANIFTYFKPYLNKK